MNIIWIKWINEGNVGPLGTFVGSFVAIAFLLIVLMISKKRKGGKK